jgi:SIR2-like domain
MTASLIDDELQRHFKSLTSLLTEGRVVPFLGAGANLCGRPRSQPWQPTGHDFLPSGSELSQYLARAFDCPEDVDLTRVSQYVWVTNGSGDLYNKLHALFDRDYPPTILHRFLAELPSLLRSKGYPPKYQLILTTNYDDLLEQAFHAAGEPFDLVSYVSEDKVLRGKFIHTPPDGDSRVIDIPNQYRELSLDRRSVILKIHGAVKRHAEDGTDDSYVITEDDYIDYLTRTELANLIPVTLAARLRKSHFLFLGYGLRDWNLRVILHRIAGEQKLTFKSWAIQRDPTKLDQKFWALRDVDILDLDLERYVSAVRGRMRLLPQAASVANA